MRLRYVLQYGKGRFWRTAKSYDAERTSYAVVSEVMFRVVCRGERYCWRIVLMPGNVLAETCEARPERS